jgi:hypothetical protein
MLAAMVRALTPLAAAAEKASVAALDQLPNAWRRFRRAPRFWERP